MISLSAANISRCYFLNSSKLERVVRFTLKSLGIKDASLSIIFVSDSRIKRLNNLYRGSDRPTDVLAFSMREGKRLLGKRPVMGDIVISVDRARKQAKRFESTFKREIYLYIIHGILHLAGYNDERPGDKRVMRRKEDEILNRLCRKINL
ncbi:MAG: rRNA maturation RNase YbeY [Candidatus Omnitrophica bacterium]|nr:rRNA maturation RNase YbeY [Candidatus Omnitrophota bacterium]